MEYFELKARKKRFNLLIWTAVILLAVSVLNAVSIDWDNAYEKYNVISIYSQIERYPFSVLVLDSGSANCVLISCEDKYILVDCGQEKADKNILDVLKIMNIDTIDLVVLTHPDKDHIGNLEQVIESAAVKRFITCKNGDYELSSFYNSLMNSLTDHNIRCENASAGDRYTFNELTLDIVSPAMIYDTSNDNSLVIKAAFRNVSVLLTGDISRKAEADILSCGTDVSADVLLVPHHGSGGSASDEFLQRIAPDYAIISVEQEEYLPSDRTLARLINYGCRLYRTDYFGNIAVLSSGENVKVVTEYDDYRGD